MTAETSVMRVREWVTVGALESSRPMDAILVLSFAFLLSPVLGYLVILAPFTLRTKIIIAAVGAVLMAVVPILVLLLAGGGHGGAAPFGVGSSLIARALEG